MPVCASSTFSTGLSTGINSGGSTVLPGHPVDATGAAVATIAAAGQPPVANFAGAPGFVPPGGPGNAVPLPPGINPSVVTAQAPPEPGCVPGPACNACFESESTITGTNWTFVGEGKGTYSKLLNYNYVGAGSGAFEKEVTTKYYGWKMRKCCVAILGAMLLASLSFLVVTEVLPRLKQRQQQQQQSATAPSPRSATVIYTHAPTPAPGPNSSAPFNCTSTNLSAAQVDWCCKFYDVGCSQTRTKSTPTSKTSGSVQQHLLFDCTLGPATEFQTWSLQHKQWCCENKKVCSAVAESTQQEQQQQQQQQQARITPPPALHPANPVPVPVPAPPQHGAAAKATTPQGSAPAQVAAQQQVAPTHAAPTQHDVPHQGATSTKPFDCQAGYTHWERGWSTFKKTWCCENEKRGCESKDKQTWQAYDCDAGLPNWKHGWSESKKKWCCKREQKGCEHDA
eukprot:CAMPEP_0172790582 /NCGR_PEP_ID=MMETSP1074-20121228/208037_1 /TAXON_ID=2916 /ORGANISM="Ceratium fusus, Strain PA161109" /LENGTH=452 /DNA_ID=CAMNT_0013627633 /DNA_START=54 /DNA_END=1412 /DNA_ORIENTATION=+